MPPVPQLDADDLTYRRNALAILYGLEGRQRADEPFLGSLLQKVYRQLRVSRGTSHDRNISGSVIRHQLPPRPPSVR